MRSKSLDQVCCYALLVMICFLVLIVLAEIANIMSPVSSDPGVYHDKNKDGGNEGFKQAPTKDDVTVTRTTTPQETECLETVVRASETYEILVCENKENHSDCLPSRMTGKCYPCRELMEDRASLQWVQTCCDVRDLCNRVGYCHHGRAECLRGKRPHCICKEGFTGDRCFETNRVNIWCSCDTTGLVPSSRCKEARFNTSSTCWTVHAPTPTQALCCVCNNDAPVDLNIYKNIPQCSIDNIDYDTDSNVCR